MFPRAPFVVLVCALAFGLVGCRPAAVESFGYAQVVPGPAFHVDHEPAAPTGPVPKMKKDGPLVQVEARFVRAAPASLARHFGLENGQVTKMLTAEQAMRSVVALQDDHYTRTLTASPITLFPGQKACVKIFEERAFVRDVAFTPGTGDDAGFTPVIDKVSVERTLTVAADIEGGQVILTHLEPVTSDLVEIRRCTGAVAWAGKLCDMTWDEPLLMEGTGPIPNPCRIALKPDQTLLLRMKYGLRQSTGSVRLYARGPVRETLQMSHALVAGRGPKAPAEAETVVLIRARVVQPDKQPTKLVPMRWTGSRPTE